MQVSDGAKARGRAGSRDEGEIPGRRAQGTAHTARGPNMASAAAPEGLAALRDSGDQDHERG